MIICRNVKYKLRHRLCKKLVLLIKRDINYEKEIKLINIQCIYAMYVILRFKSVSHVFEKRHSFSLNFLPRR